MAAKTKLNPLNGVHTAGIFADASIDGPEIGTLVIVVDRAKNLPNRKTIGKQDPFCAARLGKEAKKTTTDIRGGQTPKWDQELRFTVHDSPDYYQLKLSIFNDDKKTDLIGETWIDLRDIVVPGGGQSDQWQSLNCKGKYAGEVRIEITYYDSRPKPDKLAAQERPVTSSSQMDGMTGAQRTPVKRRPLPNNPGSENTTPSRALPELAQTPPRLQPNPPTAASIPNQSPLQAIEYQTPPSNRYRQSSHHPTAPDDGSPYSTSPQPPRSGPPHHHSVERNDKFIAYEDDRQYQSDQYSPYSAGYEGNPRTSQDYDQAAYNSPSPTNRYQRQPLQIEDQPPPPPVHRVRHSSGTPRDLVPRGTYDPVPKAVVPAPMRHDVLRSEAHRLSMGSAPPPPTASDYPGRPTYRPANSAPEVPLGLPYDASSPPRHHSYDAASDPNYRSMQPTVEDVPESWTPPAAPRHSDHIQEQYDDRRQEPGPSPAPLHLAGRGSVPGVSAHYESPQRRNHRSSDYGMSSSPAATREYASREPRQSYSTSYDSPYDPYSEREQPNELDNMALVRTRDYAPPPPIPSSLVPGVDPGLALEVASAFQQERRHERRYTQPAPISIPERDRQGSEPPRNYTFQSSSQGGSPGPYKGYDGTMVPYRGRPATSSGPSSVSNMRPRSRDHSASPNVNYTIKRKSVSPAPPPDGRRLSGVPFGPDSYDELNPAVASAKEASKPNGGEYTTADGKIITADGREVDPSDHLPMDTWAPEPEPKGPQSKPAESSRPTPAGAQPMPPSGRRPLRVTVRPHSMATAPPPTYISPDTEPAPPVSAGRNRLQKKQYRISAQPAAPAANPLGPATSQQRNSTPPRALVRAGAPGYENYSVPYGTSPRSYADGPPPVPAKVPLMSGALMPAQGNPSAGRGNEEWALMEEMSRIDIGTGRARRHGGY